MKKYAVRGIWTVTETRFVTAKSEKEARAKLENGEYDQCSDDLQFADFVGIDNVKEIV
jgi:ribosomal protein L20A (L18A)